MDYIVITGASEGIGKALALYYGNLGYPLVLIARNKMKLNEIKNSLSNVDVIPIEYDLTLSLEGLFHQLDSMHLDYEMVINNAGIGLQGEFLNHSIDKEEKLLSLNINALTILTHYFGNQMKKQHNGSIVNISSVGAMMPGPYMASYYASKAYVSSLSLSLSYEMKKEGIYLGYIQLPRIDTNFDLHAGRKEGQFKKGMPIEKAIKKITKAIKKKRIVSNIGLSTKLCNFVHRVLPNRLFLIIIGNHLIV